MYTSKLTMDFGSDRFEVISYSKGSTYVLQDKVGKRSIWFEGGDALEFDSELDIYLDALGTGALAELWGQYAEVSREDD